MLSQKFGRFIIGVIRERQTEIASASSPTGQIPDEQDYGDDEERTTSNHACNQRSVDLLDRPLVAWFVCLVQTLSGIAGQEDAGVTKDIANQVVHFGLREHTLGAFGSRFGGESGGSFDDLIKEDTEIDRSILAA